MADNFCVMPFIHAFVTPNIISPCCAYTGDLRFNSKSQYWTSEQVKKIQQNMLQNVRDNGCQICWKKEDRGYSSLRQHSNEIYKNHIEQIRGNQTLQQPFYLDLRLGNLCNLKCTMCYPGLSSQLLAEANINPKLKSRYGKNYVQENYDWPKYDDFISWCEKFLPQSIQITFTGGEPFIIPWIPNVIKKIPETQKAKCILHFTTNLTVINDELLKIFHKFREVWISVSIEGTGKTHEYVRHGHRWQKLVNNLKLLRDKKIPNLFLKFNHVVQATSYHSITDMVKFADEQKLEIRPALLENPQHFHISALTETAKIKFIEKTADYDGFNKEFVSYVRNMSNTHIKQDKSLAKHCIEHLSDLDEVRNTNFQNIIPKENLYQC